MMRWKVGGNRGRIKCLRQTHDDNVSHFCTVSVGFILAHSSLFEIGEKLEMQRTKLAKVEENTKVEENK